MFAQIKKLMAQIKKTFKTKHSSIALLFLFAFFNFLFCSAFAAIPTNEKTKSEKISFESFTTKFSHSKEVKNSPTTSTVDEEIEYNEVEVDPFTDFDIEFQQSNYIFQETHSIPSKYSRSYFYKKNNLFLLFCSLKLHLG